MDDQSTRLGKGVDGGCSHQYLGEFIVGIDGQVGDFNRRVETLTRNGVSYKTTPITGAITNNGIAIANRNQARVGSPVQVQLPTIDTWV